MKHIYWTAFIFAAGIAFSEVDWNDHKSCKACHPVIFEEWEKTRHAKAWTAATFVSQSRKRTKQDCLPCHAPKPLFETGIGMELFLRDNNRESGVDCITCHRKGKSVLGPFKDSEGECNPAHTTQFETNAMCDMCHKSIGKDWHLSSYSKKGSKDYATCADCHMKTIDRPAAKGGKTRKVYRHITYGSHDIKSLQEAFRNLKLKVKDGKIEVSLTNDLTGHTLPAGTTGRTVLILTAVKNDDGKTVALHREEYQKGSHGMGGHKKIPDTSIPPDKTVTLTYDTGIEEGDVIVKVLYKHHPSIKDRKAIEVVEKRAGF